MPEAERLKGNRTEQLQIKHDIGARHIPDWCLPVNGGPGKIRQQLDKKNPASRSKKVK